MTDLSAIARFVHAAAAVLLTGAFGFALLAGRPAFRSVHGEWEANSAAFIELQFRIARWCWLALLASALLGLWLQAAAVNAGGDINAIFILLRETQYGRVWSARMALILIFPVLFFFTSKQSASDSLKFMVAGFVVSAALLSSLALAGHSAAGEGSALLLQVAVDGFHLFAAGIWLGGLLPLTILLRHCSRRADSTGLAIARSATRRFSVLGLTSVAAMVVTGAYNSWKLVGGFAPLFGTVYGKLLLLKLSLMLPLIAIGAVNLLRLKPRIVEAQSYQGVATLLRQLRHNVVIEILLGAAILVVVGYLGVTRPARHVQPDWPFATRWDWSVVERAPKANAEVQRAIVWAALGGIALMIALLRRRRRFVTALIGLAALGYAVKVADEAVATDAYPTTYKRPAVAYQAISVSSGRQLYEDSGCASCHGTAGYGDGPLAEDLRPKPADLTAPHADAHTAGDLFWWLSHGVKNTSMPGFAQSISDEERWDLINFMRALSSGDRARALASIIENDPWLIAPDFAYVTNRGEAKTLRDHRGDRIVLLIFLDIQSTEERLKQLDEIAPALRSANLETIVVPSLIDLQNVTNRLPVSIVAEGIREITETYKLFARSFSDEGLVTAPRHVEFLIDKQGYIRARWLPAENTAWQKPATLLQQIDLLNREKPSAPAPDEHVH